MQADLNLPDYSGSRKPTIAVFKKVSKYIEKLEHEHWNLVDQIKKPEIAAQPASPASRKKKERNTAKKVNHDSLKKFWIRHFAGKDAVQNQRIDSYMSNTYLGKRRAAGLLKSAPVSKELASKAKKKHKLSKPQKEKKKKQASILDFFKKGGKWRSSSENSLAETFAAWVVRLSILFTSRAKIVNRLAMKKFKDQFDCAFESTC